MVGMSRRSSPRFSSDQLSSLKKCATETVSHCQLGVWRRRVVEVSYGSSYDYRMSVVNFRTDERSEQALAELMSDGSTASEAIRQALVDAVRLRRREQMRAESRVLMNDDADRAESRQVLSDMDELRAW
jgi:hypothetical protein